MIHFKALILTFIIVLPIFSLTVNIPDSLSISEKTEKLISLVDSLKQSNENPSQLYKEFLTPNWRNEYRKDLAEILYNQGVPLESFNTPLIMAVIMNNLDMVKKVINKETVNFKGYHGNTALHYAIELNSPNITKVLLDYGANCNIINQSEASPLMAAVNKKKNAKLVDSIQSKDEFIKLDSIISLLVEKTDFSYIASKTNYTYLHIGAFINSLPIIKKSLTAGIDINFRLAQGHTVLHIAAAECDSTIVKFLLENGAEHSIDNVKGGNALTYALRSGKLSNAKLLMHYGENLGYIKDPLQIFLQLPTKEIALFIIENSKQLRIPNILKEIIPSIIEEERFELLPEMVKIIPDAKLTSDDIDKIFKKHNEKILLHIDSLGFDIITSGKYGSHFCNAIINDMDSIVSLFLEKEVNINSIDTVIIYNDAITATPLIAALSNKKYSLAHTLLDRGADPTIVSYDDENDPLANAIGSGDVSLVKKIINAGYKISEFKNDGIYSPYTYAVLWKKYAIADYFKSINIENKLTTKDMEDLEGLLLFAMEDNTDTFDVDLVDYLLSNGVDIKTPSHKYGNVVASAIESGDTLRIQFLESKGISLSDYDIEKLLEVSFENNTDTAMIKIIFSKGAPFSNEIFQRILYSCISKREYFFYFWNCPAAPENKKSFTYDSVFTEALIRGQYEIAAFLKDSCGAKIDFDHKEYSQYDLMSNIVKWNRLDMIKVLWDTHGDDKNLLVNIAENGNYEMIRYVHKKKASIKRSIDRKNSTLIHYAAINKNSEVLKYLLKKGFDVNSANSSGDIPLGLAIVYGNLKNVKILLEAGADTSLVRKNYEYSPYELALRNDQKEIAELFISDKKTFEDEVGNKSNNLSQSESEQSPVSMTVQDSLLLAIRISDYTNVKKYLSRKILLNMTEDKEDPIEVALEYAGYEVVKLLLNSGVDFNKKYKERTIIEHAINEDRFELLDIIIKNMITHDVSKEALKDLLPIAIKYNMETIAKKIIKQGIDINSSFKNRWGDNSYLLNAYVDSPKKVKFLLDNGADPNIGFPLIRAVRNEEYETAKFLLEAGADPNVKTDYDGMVLFEEMDSATLALILEKGGNLTIKDSYGRTPLYAAIANGYSDYAIELIKVGASYDIKYLSNSPYEREKNGWTAFEFAADEGDTNVIKFLLKKGFKGRATLKKELLNINPIEIAMDNENQKLVFLLLTYNVPHPSTKSILNFILSEAVADTNIIQAKFALDNGADPNHVGDSYMSESLLETAFSLKSFKIVKLLINAGAEIIDTSSDSYYKKSFFTHVTDEYSPYYDDGSYYDSIINFMLDRVTLEELPEKEAEGLLDWLVINKRMDDVSSLLSIHNESSSFKNEFCEKMLYNTSKEKISYLLDHIDSTTLKDQPIIAKAMSLGDTLYLKELISDSRLSIKTVDEDGKNVLWDIPVNSKLTIPLFEFFISAGADINNKRKEGASLLFKALYEDNAELVKYLLKKGIDASYVTDDYYYSVKNENALSYTARKGSIKMLELLIESNKFKTDDDFMKAMLTSGDKRKIEWLIDRKSNYPNIKEYLSYSLTSAISSNSFANTKLFLELGVDPNNLDPDGNLPLNYVNDYGPEIISLLIKYGADINRYDSKGITPLISAVNRFQYDIISVLINNGADVNLSDSCMSISPLSYAVADEHCTKWLIDTLLSAGANPLSKDDQGWTPLFHALRNSDNEPLEYLLKMKVSVAQKDTYGNTPLQYLLISQKQLTNKMAILLEAGADINTTIDEGSLLHFAVLNRDYKVIEYCKEKGIKMDLKDKNGDTALALAKKMKNESIIKHLIETEGESNE